VGTSLNVQQWSTTAASNSTADTGLPTSANTMAGTDLDDMDRGIMAAVRRYVKDVGGGVTVGGSAEEITLTTNQAISSTHQALGFSIRFKAGATNTGAVTVAVDGLNAVALKNASGEDLAAGDIISGGIYDIAYDGSTYKLLGGAGQFQPVDDDLTAIAALSKTDGNFIVGNGTTWVAESGATARASLGLTIGSDVQAYSATLAAVAGGTYTGAASITTLGTVVTGTWSATTIALDKGGTGATTASGARSNLGLTIGTDVQAYSATLAAVAGGTYTGDNSITTVGTITSGTWNGTTIAVANGGTGATTASGARSNLGLGTAATVNTGTSGATVPLLNAANTWSLAQTFLSGLIAAGDVTFNAAGGGTVTVGDGSGDLVVIQGRAVTWADVADLIEGVPPGTFYVLSAAA
jgi:hypothetical protein